MTDDVDARSVTKHTQSTYTPNVGAFTRRYVIHFAYVRELSFARRETRARVAAAAATRTRHRSPNQPFFSGVFRFVGLAFFFAAALDSFVPPNSPPSVNGLATPSSSGSTHPSSA